ncbi:hypothetical protein GQ457_13G000900 [Hibiscus cannabinus]
MQCEEGQVFRPVATYSKNTWRDHFPPTEDLVFDSLTKEIDPLKEEVKDMLMASAADPIHNVKLIDSLLRLGVSYHFENDIENQLGSIFNSLQKKLFSGDGHDLNTTAICEEGKVFRPMATFSENIWRDQFPPTDDLVISHSRCFFVYDEYSSEFSKQSQVFDSLTKEMDSLKEEVKDMLMASTVDPIENVKLIDTLLRLGVSYHFENDIETQLESFFNAHQNLFSGDGRDLNSTSIVFRVFRQYGFKMSCDVFNKFTDVDGKFKEALIHDANRMLNLYEAAHLSIRGENVLEEALAFTTANLKSLAKRSSPNLAKQIEKTLNQPLNKCLPRLTARTYVSFYEEEESRNETLLKFAKIDFNGLQILYKKDIRHIARFWEENKFSSELPYARERYVEAYTWINSLFYEPCYTKWGINLAKIVLRVSILDDSFDAYGTPQELQRLIYALKRWEMSALDELQDYTKVICKVVLVVFDEIAEEAMNNYQAEVKWNGERAGIEAFEWLRNDPEIMKALNVIGRLMDDIVSHKFEQLRGHCPFSVECYMKQHNLSEEFTLKDFEKMLEDAWKDVNEECMRPTTVPRDLLLRHLNFARITYMFYKHGDGYTHPEYVKDDIFALFVDPIPI